MTMTDIQTEGQMKRFNVSISHRNLTCR